MFVALFLFGIIFTLAFIQLPLYIREEIILTPNEAVHIDALPAECSCMLSDGTVRW